MPQSAALVGIDVGGCGRGMRKPVDLVRVLLKSRDNDSPTVADRVTMTVFETLPSRLLDLRDRLFASLAGGAGADASPDGGAPAARTAADSEAAGDPGAGGGTVSAAEMAKFKAMAESWWDPDGKFRPLHRFNPVRIAFIRDALARHFGRDPAAPQPFSGLRLLDIGCGGGLLSEPMSRLGFEVTGIDALERNVQVARLHAAAVGADVTYRHTTTEALADAGHTYDVVLNMEVVEHVADRTLFLDTAAALVAPGGAMVAATLNRTPKSFLLAKVGAEYVLRWLPAGTHDWRKFVRPSEMAAGLRRGGLSVTALKGMSYLPIGDEWRITDDIDVNYLLVATRG